MKLCSMIAEHRELASKISRIERHLADHDEHIMALIQAIKEFLQPESVPRKRRIDFNVDTR